MSEKDARYLETFAGWLGTLAGDVRALSEVLSQEHPEEVRRPVAACLNYLFKSLDLIDDGIEGLGYVDDAFILRVLVSDIPASLLERPETEALRTLAEQSGLIREFLGQDDYERLARFAQTVTDLEVRGRSVEALLEDPEVRAELASDVVAWANRYQPPSLARDANNAVKLRAFLSAKLGSSDT